MVPVLFGLILLAWNAFAGTELDGLTENAASELVGHIFGERPARVLRVAPSPVSGLWEVVLELDQGKTSILYFDSSRRYFLGGPVFSLDGRNMTRERLLAFRPERIDPEAVPLDDALVLGDARAATRVIAFLSPDCRPCGRMLQAMQEASLEREDLAFFLKLLPADREGEGYWKAESIAAEGSVALLEQSLAGGEVPKLTRPVPAVARTMDLAERWGIAAVPAVLLPDGTLVEGDLSKETLLQWIASHAETPGS